MGIITFSSWCGIVACLSTVRERQRSTRRHPSGPLGYFSLLPLCTSSPTSSCWSGLVTTANMVIPLLTYWSLGTRSQSALVAAIIYSSVGPLLCPLAKCTPVGTQDLQWCGAQVAGMGSTKSPRSLGVTVNGATPVSSCWFLDPCMLPTGETAPIEVS